MSKENKLNLKEKGVSKVLETWIKINCEILLDNNHE